MFGALVVQPAVALNPAGSLHADFPSGQKLKKLLRPPGMLFRQVLGLSGVGGYVEEERGAKGAVLFLDADELPVSVPDSGGNVSAPEKALVGAPGFPEQEGAQVHPVKARREVGPGGGQGGGGEGRTFFDWTAPQDLWDPAR